MTGSSAAPGRPWPSSACATGRWRATSAPPRCGIPTAGRWTTIHIVLPAGAITRAQADAPREWRTKNGKFLFPHKALAKVFRAKWYEAMRELGWSVKASLPKQWVVDCKRVGNGDKARRYLGRYLYRGVLPEKNILRCENGQVTFAYTDNTKTRRTRTLSGADCLWRRLHHVLPTGFRRSRDSGFLYGNCKRLIHLLHRVLRFTPPQPPERKPLCCKHYGGVVEVVIHRFGAWSAQGGSAATAQGTTAAAQGAAM